MQSHRVARLGCLGRLVAFPTWLSVTSFLVLSSVSAPTSAANFVRGDVDANGARELTDAVRILGHLFLGDAAPSCLDAADVDDSGTLDISDAIALLGWLFLGSSAPPEPSACGADPTGDPLGCVEFPGCEPPSVTWTQEDLLRFAPEVHIHDLDRFLPSSVDPYYLDVVELVNADTGAVVDRQPSAERLGSHVADPADLYYLRVRAEEGGDPDGWQNDVYRGEPPVMEEGEERIRAPMYVHVLPGPNAEYMDLRYIFFYPFSGPQIFRIGVAETGLLGICSGTSKWTGFWAPFATHEGDFEHVTVRVTPDFSEVLAVYMDAHGNQLGRWWQADDPTLQFVEGTHVKAFSALSTHATYPYEDDGIVLEEAPTEGLVAAGAQTCGPVTCGFFGAIHWLNFADATRAGGPVWRPWRGTPLVELRLEPDGTVTNGQDWIAFPGRFGARWGPDLFNAELPRGICDDFDGCGTLKHCASEALLNTFALATWIGKIDDEKVDRSGPNLLSASWFLNGEVPLLFVEKKDPYLVPLNWNSPFDWSGDIDGDGKQEILTGFNDRVYVKWFLNESDGFLQQVFTVPAPVWGGGEYNWVGDVDGDGRDEIVSARFSNIYLKRLRADGLSFEQVLYENQPTFYRGSGWDYIGDIDGDGKDELISLNGSNIHVKDFSEPDGFSETVYSADPWGRPAYNWIADLDGDGTEEIVSVLNEPNNRVFVKFFTGRGFLSKSYPVPANWGGAGYNWMGDVDGDGRAEILSAYSTTLFIKRFNPDLQEPAFESSDARGVGPWGGVGFNFVGDMDNDGRDEIMSAINREIHVKALRWMPSGTRTLSVR